MKYEVVITVEALAEWSDQDGANFIQYLNHYFRPDAFDRVEPPGCYVQRIEVRPESPDRSADG